MRGYDIAPHPLIDVREQVTRNSEGDRRGHRVRNLQWLLGARTAEHVAIGEALDPSRFADRNRPVQCRVNRQRAVPSNQGPRKVGLKPAVRDGSFPWSNRLDLVDDPLRVAHRGSIREGGAVWLRDPFCIDTRSVRRETLQRLHHRRSLRKRRPLAHRRKVVLT